MDNIGDEFNQKFREMAASKTPEEWAAETAEGEKHLDELWALIDALVDRYRKINRADQPCERI
jgi:hypothetical protein